MTHVLPAGRLVRVEFEVRLPVAATHDEVEEWVEYSALNQGGISMTNPLHHHEVESFTGSVTLEDTSMRGERIEYDHKQTENGGVSYRVRYARSLAEG